MERTLVLIKPDGVERKLIGEIINAYEKRGLLITEIKMLQTDRMTAEKHYEEHKGRPYYENLISYILEDKICAMVIEGDNVVELVRKINGNKDPLKSELGSIRGLYCSDMTRNLVHASDNIKNAEREISIWFGYK